MNVWGNSLERITNNGQKIKFCLGGLKFSSVYFFSDSAKIFFPSEAYFSIYALDLLSVVIIEIIRHIIIFHFFLKTNINCFMIQRA